MFPIFLYTTNVKTLFGINLNTKICYALDANSLLIIFPCFPNQVKEVSTLHVYEVYHIQGMPLESNMCAHLFVCVFVGFNHICNQTNIVVWV
jgi:hypothetical protein